MYSQEEPTADINFSYEVKDKWCPQKRKKKRRKRSSLSLRLRYLPSCKDAWRTPWMRQWMNYSETGNKKNGEQQRTAVLRFFRFFTLSQTGASHRFLKSKLLWERAQARLYPHRGSTADFSHNGWPLRQGFANVVLFCFWLVYIFNQICGLASKEFANDFQAIPWYPPIFS